MGWLFTCRMIVFPVTGTTRALSPFFCQAEVGIRDRTVTGVQTCALPISGCSSTAGDRTAGTKVTCPARSICRPARSEERCVGKECRSRWSPYHEKKKESMCVYVVAGLFKEFVGFVAVVVVSLG